MKTTKIAITLLLVIISTLSFSQIYVKNNGLVGIGTTNPIYKLHVVGNGYFRTGNNLIRILTDNPGTEIGTSTDEIEFWYSNTGHNRLYAENFYTQSDSSSKSNIEPLSEALPIIMQLKSYSYTIDGNDSELISYGLISQEVEEILPTIVDTSKGLKLLNYTALIPFLIESVKEQQAQIEDLLDIVTIQEEEILQLKSNSILYGENQQLNKSEVPRLFDCSPNPFNDKTIIKYYIPGTTRVQSKIIICDLQGKEIKSVSLQTNGESQIEINKTDLYSGMFIYTLVVDSKIIDSKRMIVN